MQSCCHVRKSVGVNSKANLHAAWSMQVFRGLKNDVQQVAIKVLNQRDKQQLAEFAKVSKLTL